MTFKEYIKKNPVSIYINILDLSHLNLTDLDGIEKFTQLKELDISHNKIENIEPIRYLIKLNTLKISFNKIINLSSISNLKELSSLYLSDNLIEDITALKDSNIRYLILGNNPVKYLDAILDMSKLSYLALYNYYNPYYIQYTNRYVITESLSGLKKLIKSIRRKRIIGDFIK